MLMAELFVDKGLLSRSRKDEMVIARKRYEKELSRRNPNPKELKRLAKLAGVKIDNEFKVM